MKCQPPQPLHAGESNQTLLTLRGYQKKYLKALAHPLRPVVIVGQQGITEALLQAVDRALSDHELIKIKFNEFKEKAQKTTLLDRIASSTGCCRVAVIGHTAICYRPHPDPAKRSVRLPLRRTPAD